MNTLKTLFRLYKLFVRHLPVVTQYEAWSSGDAKALSNFLTSPTGTKWRQIRWERLYQSQVEAIKDGSPSAYSKGIAWGIRSLIAHDDSLLIISPAEADSAENTEKNEGQFVSVNR